VDFKRVGLKDIIPHIKPNLVLFVPVIAISLYKFMDKLMLGHMTNKAEVGYYESCDKIIQVPIALVSSLGTVMLPKISNLVANKQKERSEDYFKKAMLFAMFLSSSMGFGIMGVAAEFVPIFYGPGFE
jgi:O-antigen/teichoic acid export membrane protein